MFKIEMKGDREIIARMERVGSTMRREMKRAVTMSLLILERYIKGSKLSGQVLHVRSGDLRRSVHAVLPVVETATAVMGRVAQSGDVKYGAIHEFGGVTPPHVIEAKNVQALHFLFKGKEVFFKKVNHPGSKMPERSYMRSGLADKREEIVGLLRGAAVRGMKDAA